MKKLFTFFCATILITSSTSLKAQVNFVWADGVGGTASDQGKSITTDASGNVYTTGYFNGTADFDPGAGVFTLTATAGSDVFVSKVNAAGNFVWARAFTGVTGNDIGTSIKVDASGNVYTTGYFFGTVDFDPGASVFNLISAGNEEIFVSKLDASGNFVWAKALGGTNSDFGNSIAVDASGNVYTTGSYRGVADMDPSASTFNLPNAIFPAPFISKLDASGNFVWAKSLDGGGNSFGYAIAVDGAGNVFTAGEYNNTVDFDPNGGVFNLTSSSCEDIFISKLDASGNFVFAKSFGGVCTDHCASMCLDASGNIYTTGHFAGGPSDYDPGSGVVNISSAGAYDMFVSKLDASGNFVWVKTIGAAGASAYGTSIATDQTGNVFTTGRFFGTADFDPGAATINLTSSGMSDIFISKLTTAGNFAWAKSMGSGCGTCYDEGAGISVDALNNVYSTGFFNSTVDFDPTGGTFNVTSAGGDDIYIHKMCEIPATPLALLGPTAVCVGSTVIFSVAPVPGSTSYGWTLPGLWLGTSTTNTISAVVTNTNNLFKVFAINGCGSGASLITSVTVLPASVNAGIDYTLSCNKGQLLNVVCTPSNPTSVSWSPTVGLSSSTVLTPTIVSQNVPTQYIVTVNLNNGCVAKDTVVITPFVMTPSICIVTADSANKNNEVYWDKASYPSLDSMIVFREVTNNVFKQIGATSRKALSYFKDTARSVGPANGDPNITTYRYKIQIRDTCGRYGPKSLWHNTVYFTRSGSTFQWNLYLIEGSINPVQTYSLMVCMNPTISTTYTLVGTAAGTQFSLNDPNYNAYQNTADWRVFADLGYVCTPSFMAVKQNINTLTQGGPVSKSSSNIQNNRPQIGIKENNSGKAGIKIYPNPNHGEITIKLSNLMENTSVEIYNSLGQMVYKEKINSTSSILNLSKLANGIYQLRVLENNNLVKQEKIVKE